MPSLEISDVRLHYRVTEGDMTLPWLVFLHEGLGSSELWREFPDRVSRRTGCPALVYSRRGHGWSTPLIGPRSPDFMHEEARRVLPAVLRSLGVGEHILVGHSDGASIALIAAGDGADRTRGVVALAPHVFVEPDSQAGVEAALRSFQETDLAERMAKYHRDPAATFFGWHDIWNSPSFWDWNIEDELEGIRCPVLVIQGSDDEYGTVAQLDAVERGVSASVERVWLEECGHSPHLDLPHEVERATVHFIEGVVGDRSADRIPPFPND